MKNGVERVYCNRCGAPMYAMRGSIAGVSGGYYCAACAEVLDAGRTKSNLCFACSRVMASSEVKFVMPSRILGAKSLPTPRRLMCAECYKRFTVRSRKQASSAASVVSRRFSMAHSLLVRSMRL
jgi:hypothetical protein